MKNIYLISEKLLRQASMIDDNVDTVFLNYAILQAQETGLQEVIGTDLYDSILSQVESGTFKAPEYKTLVDKYIQPYLINETMAQIVMPIQYKIKNAGIVVANDQHYQTLTMSEVEKVQQSYQHKAVFNSNRIIEYILDNIEVFAEETLVSDKWVTIKASRNKCPIFFPQKTYSINYELYRDN